ncbi:hypothetical protein M3172_04910 [Mesobacillus subterraneus]|uniref:hypothetical protein n=1 Tax=Mesobacillus subterraneus TaxID=285983 RepID=UPI00203C35BC|nr:hypothetical protein [Mesobacillus subterraneus]MCM3572519.1 hypothetical protein [Mesobacillus subterraneus]
MGRRDGLKKSREVRGKQNYKPSAYPNDSQPKWLELFILENEDFADLRRPFFRHWTPPRRYAIKYSTIKPGHEEAKLRALEKQKQKRSERESRGQVGHGTRSNRQARQRRHG